MGRKSNTGAQADGTQPAKKERKKAAPAIDRALALLAKMPAEDVPRLREACDVKVAAAVEAAETALAKLRGQRVVSAE